MSVDRTYRRGIGFMSVRVSLAAGLTSLAVLLAGLVAASVASAEGSCPNAAERFGPSANLPDCRAYELVTPRFKEDNSTLSAIHGFADGQHVFFTSLLPLPGAQNGQEEGVLSSRTPQGWVTTPLTPPAGPGEPVGFGVKTGSFGLDFNLIKAVSFATDFSAAFVNSTFQYGELDQNKQWDTFRVAIPSGASSIESLPDSGPMTEALINPPTNYGGEYTPGAFVAGSAANGSRVYFETTAQLPMAHGSPEDTHLSGNELYERREGHTYLVGVLPDGSASACGAEVGSAGVTSLTNSNASYGTDSDTVSLDGSNVVFHSPSAGANSEDCPGESEKYYLREDNGQLDATTVELPGRYITRTTDQKKLFLGNENNLYEYEISSGQTTMVGTNGGLLGFSADGSRVYTSPGKFSGGDLSFYEDGTIKLTQIPAAGVMGANFLIPSRSARNRPAVSLDGSRLVFADSENLTSYDSKHHNEVYMYEGPNESIVCLSCNPDGSAPQQDSELLAGENAGEGGTETVVPGNLDAPENSFTPAMYPAVSNDDEHVFFDSKEGLVPQDTNGLEDVYEWEQAGAGTCGTSNTNYSAVSGGCVYLLSSGTGSNGSWIAGASEDGSSVFIVSNDSLTPQVIEASQQVYDARIGGGFPYVAPVYGCDSGQCQGPQTPAPSLLAPPPSATFVGLGNPTPETSVKVKPKVEKQTKHKKKKHKVKGRKSDKRGGRK
jgi:hypothetical protein